MPKFSCPECGSVQKKHSEEDCDMAQGVDAYYDEEEEDVPFNT